MTEPIQIDAKQIKQITDRLDAIVRLQASLLPPNITQKDKIKILSDLGFQPKEIASMVGTTSNTVSVALAEIRKKERKPDTPSTTTNSVPSDETTSQAKPEKA